MLDEVTARERLDLPMIDRGLVGKVKALEPLDEQEARHRRAHGDVLAGLGGHLFAGDLFEELGMGQLLGGGILQHRFEPFTDFDQSQFALMLAESLQLPHRREAAATGSSPSARAVHGTAACSGSSKR